MQERRNQLLKDMEEDNIDVAVFVPSKNLFYFTGNNLHQSERLFFYFLLKNGKGIYVVPRLEKDILITFSNDEVITYSDEEGIESTKKNLINLLNEANHIIVDKSSMRLIEFEYLHSINFKKYNDLAYYVNKYRMKKDKLEIEKIKTAVNILEESLMSTIPMIEVGQTEIAIAAKLEYEMRLRGSKGTPFPTIVASGYRGALPHGRASEKKIEDGELVIIDFGAIYEGYVADMTRVVNVGKVPNLALEVHDVVKQAIQESFKQIEIGMEFQELDSIARNIITEAGYGKYFTHRLGHGLGLDAHEEPYVVQNNKMKVEPGMTFTIEPGIYLPGQFGVRIEDNIAITEEGKVNLMTLSHDLISV